MARFNFIDFAEDKYNRLLTSLLFGLLVSPLVPRPSIAGFLVVLVPILVTVLVINQLQPAPRSFRIYLLITGAIALLLLLSNLGMLSSDPNRISIIAVRIGVVFLLGLPLKLITRAIFLTRRVTADTIKGGICVYLLLGTFWSNLYEIVLVLDPEAFNFPQSLSPALASELSQTGTVRNLIYFSFMTLTTTGYGDITPSNGIARGLASLEAIVGVMFPSIFISRLVGLFSSDRGKS
jgi:uncharacterized membrane protein